MVHRGLQRRDLGVQQDRRAVRLRVARERREVLGRVRVRRAVVLRKRVEDGVVEARGVGIRRGRDGRA